jgi:hypothetical protein
MACWLAVKRSVDGSARGSRSLRHGRLGEDVVTREAAGESAAADGDTAVSLLLGHEAVKNCG